MKKLWRRWLELWKVTEGRRLDAVMYCDRSRIKESDLLDIANYYRKEQGKPNIKSSRTVALWQKPGKQNTRGGQRHRQAVDCRYMFTCKKPEKTLEETDLDTHHQRENVKIVRVVAYEDASTIRSFTVDISMDDKATIKAEQKEEAFLYPLKIRRNTEGMTLLELKISLHLVLLDL